MTRRITSEIIEIDEKNEIMTRSKKRKMESKNKILTCKKQKLDDNNINIISNDNNINSSNLNSNDLINSNKIENKIEDDEEIIEIDSASEKSDDTDDDIDEYGNIKGLIDYDYKPRNYRSHRRFIYSDDEEDNEEDEENNIKNNKKPEKPEYIIEEQNYYDDEEYEEEYDEEDDDEEYEEDDEEYEEEEYLKNRAVISKNIIPNLFKLLGNNGNNDIDEYDEYFKTLDKEEQNELTDIEKKVRSINSYRDIPIKYRILKSKFPDEIKAKCLCEYERLINMSESDTEKSKYEDWLENILRIPFGNYVENKFDSQILLDIEHYLNKKIYGMNETKENIMSVIAQWINNPESVTNPIALEGPPGTGKTSIVRDGIAKALNRPFIQINLGGFKDSSTLVGHDFTYIGSRWGLLTDGLITSKCMNPIIYFDELDKMGDNSVFGSNEITGVLTHLIDSSQNSDFTDKYFAGIKIDFSKALFIFSYNDKDKVDNILADRLLVIKTKSYKKDEKIIIAKNYLLDNIINNVGSSTIKKEDFNDDILKHIIEKYTNDEKGVRNLKRCLDRLVSKYNLYKIIFDKYNVNTIESIEKHKDKSILFENVLKYKEKEKFIKDFNDNKITEIITSYFLDIFADNTKFDKPPPNMYT